MRVEWTGDSRWTTRRSAEFQSWPTAFRWSGGCLFGGPAATAFRSQHSIACWTCSTATPSESCAATSLIVGNHASARNWPVLRYSVPLRAVDAATRRRRSKPTGAPGTAWNRVDRAGAIHAGALAGVRGAYRQRIINVHHSFSRRSAARVLPGGVSPGRQVIGATSHYVTEVLDDGPIIEQDVVRVSHRDQVSDCPEGRTWSAWSLPRRTLAPGAPHSALRRQDRHLRLKNPGHP